MVCSVGGKPLFCTIMGLSPSKEFVVFAAGDTILINLELYVCYIYHALQHLAGHGQVVQLWQ